LTRARRRGSGRSGARKPCRRGRGRGRGSRPATSHTRARCWSGSAASTFTDAAGEDTDLGWRAVEAGTPVAFEPAAVVWHAVHDPGAVALVRASQRWRMGVRNVKSHPQLRGPLHRRLFWKPSHERRLLAAAGALALRRAPALALAAAVPYLLLHRGRHGSLAGTLVALPAHAALDGAEVVAMLRGSAAAGTLVL
jgi:hypothetical protein